MSGSDKMAYEVMRTTVLSTFLNSPSSMDRAYAFAWYSRMQAFVSSGRESAFEENHEVSVNDGWKIARLLEKLEINKQWDSMDFAKLCDRSGLPQRVVLPVVRYLALAARLSRDAIIALSRSIPGDVSLMDFGPGDIRLPS